MKDNMLKTIVAALAAVSMFALVTTANAGSSPNVAQQTVTFTVDTINQLAVSGDPGTLHIVAPVAGENPTDATDSTTTYSITSNDTNQKITAVLDSAMPTGLTLKINLAAPNSNASSAGTITLGASPLDVVSGITQVTAQNNAISYTLSATSAAAPVTAATRTVTLTLTAGS